MDNWTWITYPLPLEQLRLGENEFVFDVKELNPGIDGNRRIDHVEIVVTYR